MDQLWPQLRLVGQYPTTNSLDVSQISHRRNAVFFLDELKGTTQQQREIAVLENCLQRLGFEISRSASLRDLPDALKFSVDEYDLIVVFIPSGAICQAHASHVRCLSPTFPFLIVCNDCAANAVKSQCPMLVLTDASSRSLQHGEDQAGIALPLLQALCQSGATATLTSNPVTSKMIVANSGGSLIMYSDHLSSSGAAWCTAKELSVELNFSALITVDSDEAVDGRYVGGLLKHVLPKVRIRLSDKQSIVAIRFDKKVTRDTILDRLVTILPDALRATVLNQHCVTVELKGSDKDAKASCEQLRSMSGDVSPLPGYRLELTANFAVFVVLEQLSFFGLFDDEVSLRVENVTLPTSDAATAPAVLENLQQVATPPPPLASAAPLMSVTTHATVTAPAAVQKTTTAAPTSSAPDSSISLSRSELSALIKDHINDALRVEEAKWQQERKALQAEVSLLRGDVQSQSATAQRYTAIEDQLRTLRSVVSENQTQSNTERQSSLLAIQQLQQQVDAVKENAADHQLVEAALNEIRARSATVAGVHEAEERIASVARKVQQDAESSRQGVDAIKGHFEALAMQHQQLVVRVEAQRGAPEVQRLLEDAIQVVEKRVAAVEGLVRGNEGENAAFRRAFEIGLNRLYEQLRLQHDDIGKLTETTQLQVRRVDELQRDVRSADSVVGRVMEESMKASTEHVLNTLQTQVSSVKSYCVAAVERATELQNEKTDSIENKLASDMHRAIDVLRKQQAAEVQRITESVERHLSSQRQLLDELSPPRLAGSPRNEELNLFKDEMHKLTGDFDKLRNRLKHIELIQADLSAFLGSEEKRLQDMTEMTQRIEDLEASVMFIESRI